MGSIWWGVKNLINGVLLPKKVAINAILWAYNGTKFLLGNPIKLGPWGTVNSGKLRIGD